jgi:Myb-like DNA-binding protein FlbD
MSLVHLEGAKNWVRISSIMGTRSPKQCRERYCQRLRPNLNHEPITPAEGKLIEQMVTKIGKRWADIARCLQGRSDNAIKNWWYGSMKRRRRWAQLCAGADAQTTQWQQMSQCQLIPQQALSASSTCCNLPSPQRPGYFAQHNSSAVCQLQAHIAQSRPKDYFTQDTHTLGTPRLALTTRNSWDESALLSFGIQPDGTSSSGSRHSSCSTGSLHYDTSPSESPLLAHYPFCSSNCNPFESHMTATKPW